MLSIEQNDLLCRVGPGTAMGNLMREYWVPALRCPELPGPDCDPVRVMLLGERLIAFRDSSGRVGLLPNACPHRGASLFFGRNEMDGIRCAYHGWKFDVAGRCVDMPNEPPNSNFKDKVRAQAYPCVEKAGLVWTYMGPREEPPPMPEFEVFDYPDEQILTTRPTRPSCTAVTSTGRIRRAAFCGLGPLIVRRAIRSWTSMLA
jgi:phthalate 4,5-dioxygenase